VIENAYTNHAIRFVMAANVDGTRSPFGFTTPAFDLHTSALGIGEVVARSASRSLFHASKVIFDNQFPQQSMGECITIKSTPSKQALETAVQGKGCSYLGMCIAARVARHLVCKPITAEFFRLVA